MVNDWLNQGESIPTTDPGTANLVLYYPLCEGSGVTTADASGHNYTGYLGGTSILVPVVFRSGWPALRAVMRWTLTASMITLSVTTRRV